MDATEDKKLAVAVRAAATAMNKAICEAMNAGLRVEVHVQDRQTIDAKYPTPFVHSDILRDIT